MTFETHELICQNAKKSSFFNIKLVSSRRNKYFLRMSKKQAKLYREIAYVRIIQPLRGRIVSEVATPNSIPPNFNPPPLPKVAIKILTVFQRFINSKWIFRIEKTCPFPYI